MTISTSKKVAAANAKPTKTKSSSKRSKKNQISKHSPLPSSSRSECSQSSRRVSVPDVDKETDGVSSVLDVDVDSDHNMEGSDDDIVEGSEGTRGTTENPIEMIGKSEDEEDEDAQLGKGYLRD
jgi:hypothetical protein